MSLNPGHLQQRPSAKNLDHGEASQMIFTPDPAGNARYQLPGDTFFAEEKVMDIRRHTRMSPHPASCSIEAPQVQLTGADTTEWVRQRTDQLSDKYLGAAGNTLDANGVLQLFRPLGFTGTNASDYSEAGRLLYMQIFTRMVQKALREDVHDLTIVMGPPSSGKSTAIRSLGLDHLVAAYRSNEGQLAAVRREFPGLGPKGHSLADTINAAVDEALKEYIQR